ncbi:MULTISPECIES: DUF2931 family protein [unclassified Halomonas]|uniref:DUF2931 family protein n=1 Tax=unclassified Halomonas TaxID=2609666 RepID=UPI0007D9B8C0|nr:MULTISPECIES: DUF2931 family protein [unclassified Halomonas]MBT2788477.1 DUF2931 family protein [Halomonas sp. ISL-106]MBT2798068.1 DUF2931 family protein [Halomonas sp. ISL-104]OAL60629.1 hypothetical protein A6R74_18080 [Halomonas sp. ALS9]
MTAKYSMLRALLVPLSLTLTTACSSEPREYNFVISVAGGPTAWPVRVEELTFDNNWSAPGGILRGGFDDSPPGGAMVILSPKPAPKSVQARWYSYRTKTFHQIDLSLPEDFSDRVEELYEEFPQPHYLHTLIVGFSGKGEALVWWEAFCLQCDQDRSQDFSTPIVENAQANVVEGDPSRYRSQTEQFISEGLFPSPGE